MHADVVIVGGGVVGCAAACYLARAGVRTILVEAGRIGAEASGRNGGAIRQHGRSRGDLPLAMASLTLWREFAREAAFDFYFRQRGDAVVAFTEAEMERLRRTARTYRSLGLEVQVLEGAEARRVLPLLTPAARGISYCPGDAQAYPALATRALAEAAVRAGAAVLTDEPVTGLIRQADRVTGVVTARRRIACGAVVNAAGPWAQQIAEMAGVRVPILPRRSQIMVTERASPDLIVPFVSGNGMYCRQSPYHNIVIGGGGPWEQVGYDRSGTLPTISRLAARFVEVFPALRDLRVIRAFAGIVELTPDHLPLLGPVPGAEGLIMAAGLSGNGFALGPGMGHLVADLLLGREPIVPIEGFRVDRFGADYDYPALYRARTAGARELL